MHSAKRQKINEKFQGPDTDNEDDRDGDDLFENEEERTRVMNLPELQREMILAELTEARQRKLERKRLLQQAAAAEAQRGPLKSTREAREEAAKKSAIQELKAARERKAKGEKGGTARKKKEEPALEEEYDEDDDEEEEEEEEEGILAGDYVINGEDDEEDDGILERMRRAQKSAWYGEEEDEEATLEELRSIQLKSRDLVKWLKEPHFKRTVPGCLVRVRAPEKRGPDGRPILDDQGRPRVSYLVAQAVGIEQRPPGVYKDSGEKWPSPYRFGPKNEKIDLWMKISRGGSDRLYPLAVISDKDITDDEFESWLEINKQKNLVVMRLEVQEVKERLDKAHNYTYTSEDVRAAIEERKKKGLAPVNYALEKARLERELDHAVEQRNEEGAAQLQAALDQLTENMKRQGAGLGLGGGMSALNKRNKEKNFQTDFIKPSQDGPGNGGGGNGGGDGGKAAAGTTLDPFSRRATRSRVYWNTKKTGNGNGNEVVGEGEGEGGGEGEEQDNGDGDMKEVGMAEHIGNPEELAAVIDLSGLDMSLIVTNGSGGKGSGGSASSLVKNVLGGRRRNGSGGGRGVSIGGARPLTLSEYKVHRGIA